MANVADNINVSTRPSRASEAPHRTTPDGKTPPSFPIFPEPPVRTNPIRDGRATKGVVPGTAEPTLLNGSGGGSVHNQEACARTSDPTQQQHATPKNQEAAAPGAEASRGANEGRAVAGWQPEAKAAQMPNGEQGNISSPPAASKEPTHLLPTPQPKQTEARSEIDPSGRNLNALRTDKSVEAGSMGTEAPAAVRPSGGSELQSTMPQQSMSVSTADAGARTSSLDTKTSLGEVTLTGTPQQFLAARVEGSLMQKGAPQTNAPTQLATLAPKTPEIVIDTKQMQQNPTAQQDKANGQSANAAASKLSDAGNRIDERSHNQQQGARPIGTEQPAGDKTAKPDHKHTTGDNVGDKHGSTDRVVGDKGGSNLVGNRTGGDKIGDRIVGDKTGDRIISDKAGDHNGGGNKNGGRIFGDERIADRPIGSSRIVANQLGEPSNFQFGERIGDLPGDHNMTHDRINEKSPFAIQRNDQVVPIHGLIQDRIRTFNTSVDRIFDNLSQRMRAPEVQEWLQKHPNTVFESLKNTEVRDCVVKFIALVDTCMLPDRLTDGMKKIVRLADGIGKDTMRDLVKRVQRTPEGQAPKFHDFASKVKFEFATMVRLVIKEITAPRVNREQIAIKNLVQTARNILNTHFGDKVTHKTSAARVTKMDQPCGKSSRIVHQAPQSIVKSETTRPFKPISIVKSSPMMIVKSTEAPAPNTIKQSQPTDASTRPSLGDRAPFREMQEAIRVLEPRVNNICHACGSVNLDGAAKCTLCKKELKSKTRRNPANVKVARRLESGKSAKVAKGTVA